ncbi:hypothetical protein OHC33_009230 [Knufia fluminis]|uniref:CSN8/PSMD8/EIF3K domain-containing protein n=1 Tax=Knufia fluminis TaxID=191047 RepID=A0AAN8EQ10_9EURO|nr:hypothetical protein OHC33_009230 [Knufia fluminis]
MSYQPPPLNRKSSAPWERLRPVKQDPLESVGFVSKGDNRLLNIKTQETYYHKITARYMQFCTQNSKNLHEAFTSLSIDDPDAPPPASNTQSLSSSRWAVPGSRPTTPAYMIKNATATKASSTSTSSEPAEELSTILTALRKLREAILATSASAPSPAFSQRVHVFNIRLAILALHPESYHASLRYLLTSLHSQAHPLPATELREMTAYLILDTALRVDNLQEAHAIRVRAKELWGFRDKDVDIILKAVVTNNWPLFWRIRNRVDGYIRAIMHWKIEALRRSVLKAIGRSYMKCDVDWILRSTTGGEMSWEDLVEKEDVGWLRDGRIAIIRKPKLRT